MLDRIKSFNYNVDRYSSSTCETISITNISCSYLAEKEGTHVYSPCVQSCWCEKVSFFLGPFHFGDATNE